MGKQRKALSPELINFIDEQKIFFVATATEDSRINLSPKGLEGFHVKDNKTVLWLNLTGSGNETAAHLQTTPRMTVMFCAFSGKPMILRLYGTATTHLSDSEFFQEHVSVFPNTAGARQIFEMKIDLVQTSCGFGVPLYDYKSERDELTKWANKKGESGIKDYWTEKNAESLDGQSIPLPDETDLK